MEKSKPCAKDINSEGELYYQAADIVKKFESKKGTVKTLIYASGFKNLRQMFALVSEWMKYKIILDEVASECPHSFYNEPALKGRSDIASILLYEYLLGRKFGRDVGFRKMFRHYRPEIKLAVDKVLLRHGVSSFKEACKLISGPVDVCKIPRYMRVNLIKTTVDAVIKSFQEEQWEFVGTFDQDKFAVKALTLAQMQFGMDPIMPDLLVFPPGTDLHEHALTRNGSLVQQDRASCVPTHALAPTRGSTVLDCCAAPGNKTTHVASLLQDDGRVIAMDRDLKRLSTMTRLSGSSGATCIELIHQDFLTVQPDSDDARDVQFILVDPSCSGSGMLSSKSNCDGSDKDADRIQSLKRFQISILKHALKFPNVKRVVYSTCSIHEEENEEVAQEVMSHVGDQFSFAKVLPEWRGSRGVKGFPQSDCFLRLSPAQDLTQGFFVACFEKMDGAWKSDKSRVRMQVKSEADESNQEGLINETRKRKRKDFAKYNNKNGEHKESYSESADLSVLEPLNSVLVEKKKKKRKAEELKEPKQDELCSAEPHHQKAHTKQKSKKKKRKKTL